MTTETKLDFVLRAIGTAGGPEQPGDMTDEVFLLKLTNWLFRLPLGGPLSVSSATGTNDDSPTLAMKP